MCFILGDTNVICNSVAPFFFCPSDVGCFNAYFYTIAKKILAIPWSKMLFSLKCACYGNAWFVLKWTKEKKEICSRKLFFPRERNDWFSCFNSAYSDQIDWEIESEDQSMEYCIWINFISLGSFYIWFLDLSIRKNDTHFFW